MKKYLEHYAIISLLKIHACSFTDSLKRDIYLDGEVDIGKCEY